MGKSLINVSSSSIADCFFIDIPIVGLGKTILFCDDEMICSAIWYDFFEFLLSLCSLLPLLLLANINVGSNEFPKNNFCK